MTGRVGKLQLPRRSVTARFPSEGSGNSTDAERVVRFWTWFKKVPAKWSLPKDDFDEEKLVELHEQLAENFPELQCVVSWEPKKKFTIEFTCPLRPESAPLVREIVRAAPKSKAWKFIAFRPAIGFYDLYVAHLGMPYQSFPVKQALVEVLEGGPPWSLRIYAPKFTEKLRENFDKAVRLAIIAGLGERWVHEDLAALELATLNKAPKKLKPLAALAELTARKRTR